MNKGTTADPVCEICKSTPADTVQATAKSEIAICNKCLKIEKVRCDNCWEPAIPRMTDDGVHLCSDCWKELMPDMIDEETKEKS